MSNAVITKKDLLAALASLGDDDLILIKCDGGEYWGNYVEFPVIKVVQSVHGMVDGQFLGHPGGYSNTGNIPDGAMVAVLRNS